MPGEKKYSATTLARWFINRIDRDSGDTITHLKLQKMLYYAQSWHLVNFGSELFRERIEAWAHGPVVPVVWQHYRDYGWEPLPPQEKPRLTAETESYLEAVFHVYGGFTAKKLEQLTHAEAPWRAARGDLHPEARCNTEISHAAMKAFYEARTKDHAAT